MFKICAHQFRQAFLSPRLYLALILGCAIQIISVFPLLDFSKAMGNPLEFLRHSFISIPIPTQLPALFWVLF